MCGCRALASVGRSLEQQSFWEVDMFPFVDGIMVWEAAVKKPGDGIGLMQVSGNVSSS